MRLAEENDRRVDVLLRTPLDRDGLVLRRIVVPLRTGVDRLITVPFLVVVPRLTVPVLRIVDPRRT